MRIAMQAAVTTALAMALCGLAVRRRLSLCWSFVPYALAIIVCGNLATLWPERFFNRDFWLFKQAVYDACKVAIALELSWRVLRAFPGAARALRPWIYALLAATTVMVIVGPPRTYARIEEWQPRVLLGVTWLFVATTIATLWYRIPVRLWHRALLLGFSVYMVVFVGVLQLFRVNAPWMGLVDGGAYLLLTWSWAVLAWRTEPVPAGMSPALLRRLGMEAR
jgi:hypothetical protein